MTGGTIAVVSGELGRYTRFAQSLVTTQWPGPAYIRWNTGPNVAVNCNDAARNLQGEWIWFLGDDHAWDGDALVRLHAHLERPEVDIVVPRCLMKKPPYVPVIYHPRGEDGKWRPFHLSPDSTELMEIGAAGSAGMLIKRKVFDALHDPWFELGQINPAEQGEDLWFCQKATEAGFRIWVDPTVLLAHLSVVEVWPGHGGARLELGNNVTVNVQYPDAIYPSNR